MLSIMIKCDRHPRRPETGCGRCEHAVTCNRMNNGWGTRYATTPEGFLVTWETYEPRLSWFGSDAFIGSSGAVLPRVTVREDWEGWHE